MALTEPKALKKIQMFEDRARAGAKWLDEMHPKWENRIKPDELTMSDGQFCILGQLFEDFARGQEVNGNMSDKRASELGFLIKSAEGNVIKFDHKLGESLLIPVEVEPYDILDGAWVREVKTRKQARRAARVAAK